MIVGSRHTSGSGRQKILCKNTVVGCTHVPRLFRGNGSLRGLRSETLDCHAFHRLYTTISWSVKSLTLYPCARSKLTAENLTLVNPILFPQFCSPHFGVVLPNFRQPLVFLVTYPMIYNKNPILTSSKTIGRHDPILPTSSNITTELLHII